MADEMCFETKPSWQEKETKPTIQEDSLKLEKKERFIRALKLYHNIALRFTSHPPARLLRSMSPLNKNMTIQELLIAGQVVLSDIPLRHVWLMVKYPALAEFADCLLQEGDDGVQAKLIAEKLLDTAENKEEMAKELQNVLYMASKADRHSHRELEDILTDILSPPDPFKWPNVPRGMYQAAEENKWKRLKEKYQTQPDNLTFAELNDTLLMSAKHADWVTFSDCVQRGACLTGYTATEEDQDEDQEVEGDGAWAEPVQSKYIGRGPSPLHVAIQTGVFSLSKMADYVVLDEHLANSKDRHGTPLLTEAAQVDDDKAENVKLLLLHGADVNAKDGCGETVLQKLINRAVGELCHLSELARSETQESTEIYTANDREEMMQLHLQGVTRETHMLVTVIKEAVQHGQAIEWLPAREKWTVLHVLCAVGDTPNMLYCIQQGAEPKELREGLTLIDTLILQDHLPPFRKIITLQFLLKDLKLGPFHIKIVRHRIDYQAESDDQYGTYKYPLKHLLRSPRGVDFELLKLLYTNQALWLGELQEGTRKEGLPWTLHLSLPQ